MRACLSRGKTAAVSRARSLVWPPNASMADFDWRISMATVDVAGPFSAFDGIDRHLSVLSGHLRLTVDGVERSIEAGQGLAFAGDIPVYGEPIGGPVTDLNVMTRRGRYKARVTPVKVHELLPPSDGVTALFAMLPTRVCSHALNRHDGLWLDDWPVAPVHNGAGPLIHVDILKL